MDLVSEELTRLDLLLLLDLIGAPHPTFINVIDPATGLMLNLLLTYSNLLVGQ